PIAEAMRLVVAEQVAEGRSKEEIQAWFTARYGDEVLLDPPRRGAGWVLWLLPMGVLGGGAGVLVAGRRHRLLTFGAPAAVVAVLIAAWTLPGDRFEEAPPAGADEQVSAIPVLSAAAAESPGNLTLRLALARGLEDEGRFDDAAQEYAAAARLSPMEPGIRYRHAFALLRGGDQDRAEDVLTQSLDIDADHPATLLLLGSIRQQQDGADGTDLLHRFLQVAPDHPSAAEVRAWLEEED